MRCCDVRSRAVVREGQIRTRMGVEKEGWNG